MLVRSFDAPCPIVMPIITVQTIIASTMPIASLLMIVPPIAC